MSDLPLLLLDISAFTEFDEGRLKGRILRSLVKCLVKGDRDVTRIGDEVASGDFWRGSIVGRGILLMKCIRY